MKLRKLIAAAAASAVTVSAMGAFSASALSGGNVIDFEDGDCSFVYMNVDDETSDSSVLTVEEYDGSKQLKVDVQNCTFVPKVWFDVLSMVSKADSVKIKSIEFDLTLVPKNAEDAVGWAGGAIGAAGKYGAQVDPDWSQGDWSCDDANAYEPGLAAKTHITRKFLLPKDMFTETSESPFFGLMRWGGDDRTPYVMYFDNIKFLDADGNALNILSGGSASAAPAADSSTASAGTGNIPTAAAASVMAVAAAAAAAFRKRK